MRSRAKFLGHPIHPMLVVFPLGLFGTAVLFDLLYLSNGDPILPRASYYMMGAGLVGGLLAAVFGAIDWLALPYLSRAWNLGLLHGIGNIFIVGLFTLSWLSRGDNLSNDPSTSALVLSFLGMGLALVTAWLGGELVYRLGVGVDPEANVNASSSLSQETRGLPQEKRAEE